MGKIAQAVSFFNKSVRVVFQIDLITIGTLINGVLKALNTVYAQVIYTVQVFIVFAKTNKLIKPSVVARASVKLLNAVIRRNI
jgi:hypothetical protein